MKRIWTENKINKLKELYPNKKYSIKDIAELLNKTVPATKARAGLLKLSRNYHTVWTDEMTINLKKEYPFTEVRFISEKLKIGKSCIYRKAKELGVKKDISFLKRMANGLTERGDAYRYQKGHTPASKGLKQTDYMTPEAIERTKATRFKKGNKPHNTKSDGHISIRYHQNKTPYKYIRIAEGEWVLYHYYIWEKEKGPVPEGKILAFKNGDSLKVEIENLELITQAENMLRNSKHDIPREVIPTMVLISELKNTIKLKQDGKK